MCALAFVIGWLGRDWMPCSYCTDTQSQMKALGYLPAWWCQWVIMPTNQSTTDSRETSNFDIAITHLYVPNSTCDTHTHRDQQPSHMFHFEIYFSFRFFFMTTIMPIIISCGCCVCVCMISWKITWICVTHTHSHGTHPSHSGRITFTLSISKRNRISIPFQQHFNWQIEDVCVCVLF